MPFDLALGFPSVTSGMMWAQRTVSGGKGGGGKAWAGRQEQGINRKVRDGGWPREGVGQALCPRSPAAQGKPPRAATCREARAGRGPAAPAAAHTSLCPVAVLCTFLKLPPNIVCINRRGPSCFALSRALHVRLQLT